MRLCELYNALAAYIQLCMLSVIGLQHCDSVLLVRYGGGVLKYGPA